MDGDNAQKFREELFSEGGVKFFGHSALLHYFFKIRQLTPAHSREAPHAPGLCFLPILLAVGLLCVFLQNVLIIFRIAIVSHVSPRMLSRIQVLCSPFAVTILCPITGLSRIAGPGDPPCLPIPILLAGGALG